MRDAFDSTLDYKTIDFRKHLELFVGMDMARKFLQMGFTRAIRKERGCRI